MQEVLNQIEEVNWTQELSPSCPIEQLPPLPSGAFTTGATTGINSVADLPAPGSSGQSLVLSTDEIIELTTGDIGLIESTLPHPTLPPSTAPDSRPPGVTRIQTPSSLGAEFPASEPSATPAPAPEPVAQSENVF